MKRLGLLVAIGLVATLTACGGSSSGGGGTTTFTLTASGMASGSEIAETFIYDVECTGTNASPALSWTNAPAAAESFAVTVTDDDSTPANFVHWIVYDIATTVSSLAQGTAAPTGASFGPNDYATGVDEYDGPCPPTGETHTYRFKVWALDTDDVTNGVDITSPSAIMTAIDAHDIDSAVLTREYTGSSSGGGGGGTTTFTLTAPGMASGSEIASTFIYDTSGCTGSNASPALSWTNAPDAALSFAVTVTDDDSTPADFVHWIYYNIATTVSSLAQGDTTSGTDGSNDYATGTNEYDGPCPPTGETHTYRFKVWALDTADITTSAGIDISDPSSIMTAIDAHDIDSAALTREFTGP